MRLIVSILILSISFTGICQSNKTLTIDFDIVKYNQGKLFIAIYNTQESFLKKPLVGSVVEVKNGKATATFKDLKPGEYAVSSFYDKNDNGKLDTNFLGIPKEPTGVSNNPKPRMGPPRYKDAKFSISSANKTINIKF